MKSQFLSICASVLLATFLACGRSSRTIRIGALAPLTGEAAGFGASTRNGYQLAVQEWNARGGVLGRPLELMLRDDQGSPAEGLGALTRLLEQDRVSALLGASLSKVSYVTAPILQSLGIPMISPTSSDPQLTAVGDHIYRICCTDQAQGGSAAAFAYRDLRARRAACIYDSASVYPAELAQAFQSRFTSLGGRMVAFLPHPAGSITMAAQITRLVRARPDVLYLPDLCAEAALLAQEARAQGFKGALMGGDGWDAPALAHSRGLESGFFTGNFSQDEDRPVVQEFVRNYRKRHGQDPDACAALAYDSGSVLFDAIRRAGTASGPALNAALAASDYPGVTGQIRFDPQRNPAKPPLIIEIKSGRRFYRGKPAIESGPETPCNLPALGDDGGRQEKPLRNATNISNLRH
ncbi:MAG: ABC transporter substrate-binding protein [Holophaga sp.]|nr:ABC transporter substrate-binding protein [Holophaga sp.]